MIDAIGDTVLALSLCCVLLMFALGWPTLFVYCGALVVFALLSAVVMTLGHDNPNTRPPHDA